MNSQELSLWNRISGFNLDDPNAAFPFSAKLAKEQKWSRDFVRRAIEEYKRFVFLACKHGGQVSPSKIVDEVWHLHLTYTRNYWEVFCNSVLQQKLHHFPSNGGVDEDMKYTMMYANTLELYESSFNTSPPSDIWPQAVGQPRKPAGDFAFVRSSEVVCQWSIACFDGFRYRRVCSRKGESLI